MGKRLEHYIRLQNMTQRAKQNLTVWEECAHCTPQSNKSNNEVGRLLLENGFIIDDEIFDDYLNRSLKTYVGDPEDETELLNKIIDIESSNGIEWTIDTIAGV
jgi:hypothetical protein